MKNFVQNGDYVEVVLPYARLSGEGVKVGAGLFGVCVVDGASGDSINVHTEGVYDLTAATGSGNDALVGAVAYWDDANKRITPQASSHLAVGVFLMAKATTDAVARVRLS
jgi:predicted RecA/RadA family phage recombinase